MRNVSKVLRRPFPLLAAAAIAGLLSFAVVSAAHADTQSQNADLTVTVLWHPPTVSAGTLVTLEASVKNNTTTPQYVKVKATLTGPQGRSLTIPFPVLLRAGETRSLPLSFMVPRRLPTGTYTLTVAATNQNGTSTASDTLTVQ